VRDVPFGAPAGLLQRLGRVEVRVGDLIEAVEQLSAALTAPGATPSDLDLAVVDLPGRTPMLLIEEAGRRTRVPLPELAADMTRARVPVTGDGVTAALRSWLDRRPVPDTAAAAAGIAVLDWTDVRQSALGWRVVVERDGTAAPWRPSRTATLPGVHQTRSAALGRSYTVPTDLRVEGPVALWSHPTVPGLGTAVLVRPEELLHELADAGLRLRDMHVVVTPRRPVACADAAVARRLAAEATEASMTLPWRALTDLGWV
jgi:hypothetical protein